MATSVAIAVWSGSASAHPGEDERLKQLSIRIQAAPDDVELRILHADAAIRAGHPARALAQARRITALAPDEIETHRIRAEALRAHKKDAQALRAYDAYLDVVPAGPRKGKAHAARARIHLDADELDRARADYDAALEHVITPDLVLERGRLDETRDRLGDAAAGYRAGLERLGPAVTIQLALAHVELRREQPRAALEIVDALLDRDRGRSDWVLLRADVLDQLDQPLAALFHRVAALALAHRALHRRDISLHRLAVARAEFALGRRAQAQHQLDRVLKASPDLHPATELQRRIQESNR